MCVLGERVGQRGAGVPDRLAQPLPPVQVPESHVVDTGEEPGRHCAHTAHADVPLAVARLAADDERVGGHDRPGAGGSRCQVGADGVDCRPQHRLVPRARSAPEGGPARAGSR